jgi:hypothetical protein
MKFTYASGSRPLEGYTIKRGVGRGGFGEVYFATSDAGKEVAIKLIRRNLEVELRGVTQCLNLKHPNLIGLYDIRTDDSGDQWVIMEYVSGESLEDVIERNPSGMPLEQVMWWIRGICQGVAYLHDHGIVHRDLKPGNIFSDEGTVKIGDYGLAKFISCSRRSGQTESVGTVHYMAPEIANGRYGREIDTYALGIILFEMLTGRVPFEGESVGEVLMKHLTAEPDLSALEQPYRDIVQRALAKDPNLRISSVNEIISLLPGYAEVPSVPTTPRITPIRHEADDSLRPAVRDVGASILRDIREADAAVARGVREADASIARELGWGANGKAPAGNEVIEEPIWRAIRDVFAGFAPKWNGKGDQQLRPLHRALIVFAAVAMCIWFFNVIIRLTVPLAICYGIYYIIWASAIRPGLQRNSGDKAAPLANLASSKAPVDQQTIAWPQPSSAPPAKQAAAKVERAARRRRPNWRDAALREISTKPAREKLSELLGSMLLAAMFAAVAACIGPMLLGARFHSEQMAMHLWLTMIGTLGSWAILVPAKFTEGKLEDQVPLRVTLFATGAAVGVAAWLLGESLLLKSPGWHSPIDAGRGLVSQELLDWPVTNESLNPSLAVYVAYFGFLFLLPRWWRQAESTRTARISLWWVLVSVFWAWVLHLFWWFPQPTGMMAAGVIATATQLSSPWMPPSRRRQLSEMTEQIA